MKRDFQIIQAVNDNWVVLSEMGVPLLASRRQAVAEAFGKALAHRADVALIVHQHGEQRLRYSGRDLTYAGGLLGRDPRLFRLATGWNPIDPQSSCLARDVYLDDTLVGRIVDTTAEIYPTSPSNIRIFS